MIGLQIYPASKEQVAHDEFYLVVAREGRSQNYLILNREYNSKEHHITILIFNIKNILWMIDFERERVVININHGSLVGGLRITMADSLII